MPKTFTNIGGVDLTKKQARKVAQAAQAASRVRGYCNETNNVLRDMGLPVPARKVTLTFLIDHDGAEGDDVSEYLTEANYWQPRNDYYSVSNRRDLTVTVEDIDS